MNNQSTEQHWQVLVLLLKNIAAEKGITREQISDKTGMKASSISRIFSLRYRVTLANYVSIAQAIGVNLFIDDKDSKAVEDAEEALRKEQEQGDDIRDILIDFIADWYKDNPTVSKEKIIKMADNYLAKFPNGQPTITKKHVHIPIMDGKAHVTWHGKESPCDKQMKAFEKMAKIAYDNADKLTEQPSIELSKLSKLDLKQMLLEIFEHRMGDFTIDHYVTLIFYSLTNTK